MKKGDPGYEKYKVRMREKMRRYYRDGTKSGKYIKFMAGLRAKAISILISEHKPEFKKILLELKLSTGVKE